MININIELSGLNGKNHPDFAHKISYFFHQIKDNHISDKGTLLTIYEFGHFLRKQFPSANLGEIQKELKFYINNFKNAAVPSVHHLVLTYSGNAEFLHLDVDVDDVSEQGSLRLSVKDSLTLGLNCFNYLAGESRMTDAIQTFQKDNEEIIDLGAIQARKFILTGLLPMLTARNKQEAAFEKLRTYGLSKIESSNPLDKAKGQTALNLADDLTNYTHQYFMEGHRANAAGEFKKNCATAIKNAKQVIGTHATPTWLRLIGQAALAISGILTLGLTFWAKAIYTKKTTGKVSLFFDCTVGHGKLDNVKTALNLITPAYKL